MKSISTFTWLSSKTFSNKSSKYIIKLLLCFLFPCISFSQGWAPLGATWHIGVIESYCCPNKGYRKITSISDSIILSNSCKVLKVEYFNSNSILFKVDTLYQYENNGIIYEYVNNQFYTLFDFNLVAGDTWSTSVPFPSPFAFATGNPPDTIVNIIVDSVSSLIINGQNRKLLYVHSQNNDWEFLNPIIEGIGSAGGFHPYIYGWLDFDLPFFRCYEDSVINYSVYTPCDNIINDVNEYYHTISDLVYPNPFSDRLIIKYTGTMSWIKLFDIYGKELIVDIISNVNNTVDIDTSKLAAGAYFVIINNRKHYIVKG